MNGWILQKDAQTKIPSYETQKLIKEAANQGINMQLYDPRQLEIVVTREDRKSVILDEKVTKIPDFILPRMGASTTYFALAVIRHLERLGVYCVNSSGAIETVKDKLYQLQILAPNFPVPKTMLAKFPVESKLVEKYLGFPAVVKALSGSQGSGVFLCENSNEFEDLTQLIEITNKNANIIIQEFISGSSGRDLRVFVIGDKVIGGMERKSANQSFKANYSKGGTVSNYKVDSELEELVLKITKEVGLEIAGVDLLFDEDGWKVCEVNSSPGFKGLEQAIEINVAAEIISYIKSKF